MKFLKKVSFSLFLFIVLNLTVFQAAAQLVLFDILDSGTSKDALGEEVTGDLIAYFPNVKGSQASLRTGNYTLIIKGDLYGVDSGTKYEANGVIVNIDTSSPVNGVITTKYISRLQIVGGGTVVSITIEIRVTSTGRNNPILNEVIPI